MKPQVIIKRVYDEPSKKDGYRVLVDRLWPRGLKKETVKLDKWAKELAPETALRKWFNHVPEKWDAFQKKYTKALEKNKAVADFIEQHRHLKIITLLYAAKDEQHTHALVLQHFLQQRFGD